MKTTEGQKRRKHLAAMAALLCVLVASLAVSAAPAAAETEGGETAPIREWPEGFGSIIGPESPQRFPFHVELAERQELRQISATEAGVFYVDGVESFGLVADKAHDAEGVKVPTTLEVTGEEEVTLVVHHRAGNPLAGGAPFDYPIHEGEGWEGGDVTTYVQGPPDETELREMLEREEEAKRGVAEASAVESAASCKVPALRGFDLRATKARLRAGDCNLGKIYLAHGATAAKGKVVKQFHVAGTELAAGAPVAVKLGAR